MMVAMMVATLSLTACGGSDEKELVGEWIVTPEIEGSEPTHFTFNSDGTYVETKSDGEYKGEWSLSGFVLSLSNKYGTFAYEIIEKEKGKMKVQLKGFGMNFVYEKVK